ncbi:MAG: endonuclease domain-containing protein [Patescibacteria group bacterium]
MTNYIYNSPSLKKKRQTLRHNQTPTEQLLWQKLRNKQILGVKFYRQYSIGNYILDFYCPYYKLAIELDGSQHLVETKIQHDSERTIFLNNYGVRVLRFYNNDIFNNLNGILEKIIDEIDKLSNSSQPPLT